LQHPRKTIATSLEKTLQHEKTEKKNVKGDRFEVQTAPSPGPPPPRPDLEKRKRKRRKT